MKPHAPPSAESADSGAAVSKLPITSLASHSTRTCTKLSGHEMGGPTFWTAENLLTSLLVCFLASLLLGACSYFLISINAGHKDWKERLGVAFKVFYRSFICCLCPVFACCCYYFVSRKRRCFLKSNWVLPKCFFRCILCTNNVKKIDWSHNSKCKSELEEKYNEIPDSPAFACAKCNNEPFKIWPKEKLALTHRLWCSKCEQVIVRSPEQNIHVCFLCDKMLCGRHINPGPWNRGRTIVDWAFLENLHTADDYQQDLSIQQPAASTSLASGSEPSSHNRDNNPASKSSNPPTTKNFTPSAPSPSLQNSSRLNRLTTERPMTEQSLLSPRPEGSSHTSIEICHDLPPSYDAAMQDEDSTY